MSRRAFIVAGVGAGSLLLGSAAAVRHVAGRINTIAVHPRERLDALRGDGSTHLLARFPGLAAHLPWLPLGTFPTPVQRLPALDGASDVQLFVKRDDLSSSLYGGNKVRKLEHLLAGALLAGRSTIVTVGGLGTHHGLATALHGRELGLSVRLALYRQPVTPHVQRTLRAIIAAGADVRYAGSDVGAALAARALFRDSEAAGGTPGFIVFGGSSRAGTIGYVNAALELAEQVRAGAMPEPDRIFVPLGTCGTAAGLAAGCRLAGLRTRVTGVRVTPPYVANRFLVSYMANDALDFLRRSELSLPPVRVRTTDIDVVGDQLGAGYGHATAAGEAATAWAHDVLVLESTYTAKALAACLAWCRGRARPGEVVLYWHTVNSAPLHEASSFDGVPDSIRAVLDA